MATDITQGIRSMFEQLWNRGELATVDQQCAPGYQAHLSLVGDLDREGLKQMVRTFRSAFPDLKLRIEDLTTSGNSATVRWIATGTHRGDLMGIPATHRSGDTTGIDVFRFEGDQIREHWGVWDVYQMLQNLGVAPALGGATTGAQSGVQTPSPAPEARH